MLCFNEVLPLITNRHGLVQDFEKAPVTIYSKGPLFVVFIHNKSGKLWFRHEF